ncbi:GNAT family N-acetyltransferase [Pontibacter sp. G13]|uniref:GNAT family N-acetyltransferase n=1 Tax=Pontibacter sp. G13 TaxID=3074898 RepID=UPI00288A717D|nr:GNAT family N-acetyltransferase [Pontibacter sp. G13]WNJ19726.1 GNAT family N-acetyltransferase [Pontibacter sp. G13]
MSTPIIQTERLNLRTWLPKDFAPMAELNLDERVMAYFPSTQSPEDTQNFMDRMNKLYDERGYCFFAIELRETSAFIGMTGLSFVDWKADFTPCVEIGWRLRRSAWNQGYATEAATACLEFGFQQLELDEILSFASHANLPSIAVMERIGMTKRSEFQHPKLLEHPSLNPCVLYGITIDEPIKAKYAG